MPLSGETKHTNTHTNNNNSGNKMFLWSELPLAVVCFYLTFCPKNTHLNLTELTLLLCVACGVSRYFSVRMFLLRNSTFIFDGLLTYTDFTNIYAYTKHCQNTEINVLEIMNICRECKYFWLRYWGVQGEKSFFCWKLILPFDSVGFAVAVEGRHSHRAAVLFMTI